MVTGGDKNGTHADATKASVGCSTIECALPPTNLHHHAMKVDKAARAKANAQQPCVLWFTGLSGAGKSTIADLAEQGRHALCHRTMLRTTTMIEGTNENIFLFYPPYYGVLARCPLFTVDT